MTEITNRAAPGRFSQLAGKTLSTISKDQVKPQKDPVLVPDPSDDEPLSDQANEPKPKTRKRDPTLELVVVDDDNSTPLPGKQKTPKKSQPLEDKAADALCQCLKGEARAIQYNLELTALVEYRNKFVPNLKGPSNTDDHSEYLTKVQDISWSYLAKENLLTARQFINELQSFKNKEVIEWGTRSCGKEVCWDPAGKCQDRAHQGPVRHLGPPQCRGPNNRCPRLRLRAGLEHRALRHRERSFHQEGGEKRTIPMEGSFGDGKSNLQVLPVLFLRFHKSPDSKQSHPHAPAPLFGLRDARLLDGNTQHRDHVEACCYPQTAHFGAHCGVQEEIDMGTTIPVSYIPNHQFTRTGDSGYH